MRGPIDFFVVRDGLGYVAINRRGEAVTKHMSLQKSAFTAIDLYLDTQRAIAEAARLCDRFCL